MADTATLDDAIARFIAETGAQPGDIVVVHLSEGAARQAAAERVARFRRVSPGAAGPQGDVALSPSGSQARGESGSTSLRIEGLRSIEVLADGSVSVSGERVFVSGCIDSAASRAAESLPPDISQAEERVWPPLFEEPSGNFTPEAFAAACQAMARKWAELCASRGQ